MSQKTISGTSLDDLRGYFDALAFGVVVRGLDGEPLYANAEAARLLNLTLPQLLGRRPRPATWRLLNEHGAPLSKEELLGACEAPSPDDSALRLYCMYDEKRKHRRWLEVSERVVDGPKGQATLIITSLVDVTERKLAERRLSAEHLVSEILNDSDDLRTAAPRLLAALGERLGWIVGELWLYAADDAQLTRAALWIEGEGTRPDGDVVARRFNRGEGMPGHVVASGEPLWIENVLEADLFERIPMARRVGLRGAFGFPILSRGEARGALLFFSPHIVRPDDELLQVVTTIGHQIGQFVERKQAEESVRESEQRKAAIIEAALDAIITIDAGGRVLEFNRSAEEMFGYSRDEVVGRVMGELIVPEQYREAHLAGMNRLLSTGVPRILGRRLQMPAIRADGDSFPVELTVTQVQREGRIVFTGHLRDITAEKEAEEERARLFAQLERQKARLDAIVAAVPGVVWEAWGDPDAASQRIDFVSDYVTHMLGYSVEEWISTPNFWLTIVHPDDRVMAASRAAEIYRSGGEGTITFRWMTKDGRALWVYAHSVVIRDDEGNPVGMRGVTLDITPRVRAEQAQEFLAEASTLLASSLDYETTLASVARLAVPTLGDWCSVDIFDEEGNPHLIAVEHRDPEKIQLVYQMREEYPRARTRDEVMGQLYESGQPMIWHEISDDLLEQMAEDERHLGMMRSLGVRSVVIVPLRVRERTVGTIAIASDSSGRRYAEEDLRITIGLAQRAAMAIDNAQLYQEARHAIESRDTFLSIASHELKSPLTTLYGTVSLLRRRAARNGNMAELTERELGLLHDQARRLNQWIDRLLDLSRIEGGQFEIARETLDLTALLDRLVDEYRTLLPEGRTIDYVSPESPIEIVGDEVRLEQVVQNLLSNAIKYSRDDGRIELRLFTRDESVVIEVTDEGIGIPEDALTSLFDRFYRTDAAREQRVSGAGLGLYIVNRIVTEHGGRIDVESEVGQGSTFRVTLPR